MFATAVDTFELWEKSQCMFMLGNDVQGMEYASIAREIDELRASLAAANKSNDQLRARIRQLETCRG